ncbi:MAG: site-specific integrase [Eubacteriales bacterium]|nr:site-specific integrase [Eubacteriales bacterium]
MVDTKEKKLPKGITLRSDGYYMGRFTYYGERYTLYDKDLKILKKKLEDLRYELEHGLYAKESVITIDDWFHTWIEEYKKPTVKQGTVGVYQDNYDSYIKKPFGKKKLKDLRPEQIQNLYNTLNKEGYSRNTIELVSVVLSGMYKQAYKNQLIQKNPVPLATLPKMTERKERRVLSKEEQEIFMESAKNHQYYYTFELALSTGMRSGEIRGLEWQDIDFSNRIIHVRGTLVQNRYGFYKDLPKTQSSYRDIPMLDNVYTLLKQRKKCQSEQKLLLGNEWKPLKGLENLIVTTNTGHPVGKGYLNNAINRITLKIQKEYPEFEELSIHTMRHTFATRCIENGMEPQVLKAILGHSKLSMTMDLYAHVLPDTKSKEIQKIANLFRSEYVS